MSSGEDRTPNLEIGKVIIEIINVLKIFCGCLSVKSCQYICRFLQLHSEKSAISLFDFNQRQIRQAGNVLVQHY